MSAGDAAAAAAPASRLVGNLASVASNLTWALTFPLTAALLAGWEPSLLAAARLAVAALSLWLVMLVLRRRPRLPDVSLALILRLSALMATGVVLLVWGQTMADPVTASIIAVTMPLISAVLGWLEGRERLDRTLVLALGFALAGGIMAGLGRGGAVLHPTLPGLGELVVLAAFVAWTMFGRATVRRLAQVDDLTRTAVMATGAAFWLGLVALVLLATGLVPPRLDLGATALLQLLLMGAVGVGLATVLWFVGARHLGVTVAAMHQNAVPFYVMLMGLAAGGTVQLAPVLGALLVAVGALIAQRRRSA